MKSNKGELIRMQSFLEEIQNLENLIELHRSEDNDFMVSQYEVLKLRLLKKLLAILIQSDLSEPQTFALVNQLLEKYYPEAHDQFMAPGEAQPVAEVVHSFLNRKTARYSPSQPTMLALHEEANIPAYNKKKK